MSVRNSTSLAELERQFDLKLFDRFRKIVAFERKLGRDLLPQAIELIDRASEFEDRLQGHVGFGGLRIGATLTIRNYLATLIVATFLKRHQSPRVALEVHNTSTIISASPGTRARPGADQGTCRHPDLEGWSRGSATNYRGVLRADPPAAARGRASVNEAAPGSLDSPEKPAQAPGRYSNGPFSIHRGSDPAGAQAYGRRSSVPSRSGLGIGCISRLALRETFRRGSLVDRNTGLDLPAFHFLWHRENIIPSRCGLSSSSVGR